MYKMSDTFSTISNADSTVSMMESSTKVGVKGSDVYTIEGVGNKLLALSALLNRGIEQSLLQTTMNSILASENPEFEELFVLTFQTRDIRGGKGERDVFYNMYSILLQHRKTAGMALNLLKLIPVFGSWHDLFVIADKSNNIDLITSIHTIVIQQLNADKIAMSENKAISLLAKWIPRENRMGAQAKMLAKRLFVGETQISNRMKAYRKLVSGLNRVLNTTEIHMCDNTWNVIEPAKVPARCNHKNVKAFLNQTLTHGNVRFPNNEIRIECANNFKDHFAKTASGEVKALGSQTMYPHEIVKSAHMLIENSNHPCLSADDDKMNSLRGVWRSMVNEAKKNGGLGRSLAMCDFSGSMMSSSSNGDTPYYVSMAMGLLISEVTTDEFANTLLTFDSKPTIHTLPTSDDLFVRLASLPRQYGHGMSTDFQKAMDCVLGRLVSQRCPPGSEPENLIVLTDMNWDAASGSSNADYNHVVKRDSWQTHVEMIRENFKRTGETMWGTGFSMPRIVIWNIASTSTDFHARADTDGVVMLSGWSPSLFKVLQNKGVVIQTPLQALQVQLEDVRYDVVRNAIRSFNLITVNSMMGSLE